MSAIMDESLLSACRQGDIATVLGRLDSLGDPDPRSDEGWTPLTVAARHDQRALVLALLDRGADVNAANRRGTTVFMYAKTPVPPSRTRTVLPSNIGYR